MYGIFLFTDEDYVEHVARLEATLVRVRKQGVDSRTLYGRVTRGWVVWSSERRARQRQLVSDLWNAQSPYTIRGEKAMLLGGLDGAGKTTWRRSDKAFDARGYLIIDAHEIAEEMAKRGMTPHIDGLSPMESSPLAHEEAWEIADRLADKARRRGCNVLWEIPMNAPLDARIDAIKAWGHELFGSFVDVPVDVARRQAVARHRRSEEVYRNGRGVGGWLIPEEVHESCRPTAEPMVITTPTSTSGESVKSLVDQFEHGDCTIGDLRRGLLLRWTARSAIAKEPAGWVEIYRRCELPPHDDDLFWVSAAEDRGILTSGQADELFSEIERAHEYST